MDIRDPDAKESKMWAKLAYLGRTCKPKMYMCVEAMVTPSGIITLIPGDTAILSRIGAVDSIKCPVAPVSAIDTMLD